jgi:hypothetical protein
MIRETASAPEHLRMDNGPELIAWALRDWCPMHHTTTSYIGRPRQRPSPTTATWADDEIVGNGPPVGLHFQPALPAMT